MKKKIHHIHGNLPFLSKALISSSVPPLHLTSSSTSSETSDFAVKASVLEENLTEEEVTIARVFRQCGPSVAYVTSFYSQPPRNTAPFPSNGSTQRGRGQKNDKKTAQQQQQQKQQKRQKQTQKKNNENPRGTSLGSGSGFMIESDGGYLVTNYHVIQRAYEINQSFQQIRNLTMTTLPQTFLSPFSSTNTNILDNTSIKSAYTNLVNITSTALNLGISDQNYTPAQVFVRINSSTKYQGADIVGVKPELDVAVLKIITDPINDNSNEKNGGNITTAAKLTYPSLQVGSSSNLLVGQRVVAIGNPFGLDQSLSSGVVSALNREVTGVAGNKIQNCIQTDAAINPGNSGGPLLNSRGELIGVNTAIITTSGSNAGIGFAVPADEVMSATNSIIDFDRVKRRSTKRGTLGITLASDQLTQSICNTKNETKTYGVLVLKVKHGSAGEKGGLTPTKVEDGKLIQRGDVIIAINGNQIKGGVKEVQEDLRKRIQGEQLMLTVENEDGEKRVVYVSLSKCF